MATSKPSTHTHAKSPARLSADIWAPKVATAARYRQAAKRHMAKADGYIAIAQALEAEAEAIKEQSA
jgi:hypothetical protein